jgi:putative transcriptional regulator
VSRRESSFQCSSSRYNQEEEDDDDDDEEIDADSLGDWRAFRRNLAGRMTNAADEEPTSVANKISTENEKVLRTQNQVLANEYKTGAWAHETSMPEVGGLVCRLPLEVEIYRNYRHSLIGKKLRSSHAFAEEDTKEWYKSAQMLVENEMQDIAEHAQGGGQIDAATLNDEAAEMLQLYIENQETWQEVCLVLERNVERGTATTLVLNRPMAMKLTENLARLVLNGAFTTINLGKKKDLVKFVLAFGNECAVYVGGSQGQEEPAIMLHGIADLPGATEISPNSGIYRGGIQAAIDGVLEGKYQPLDFRFFLGRHVYDESTLDVQVLLGKYQPIACARSLALKQCISLPKPLWHEVLELCGGELKEISSLEMLKRDDLQFEIVDEDEEDAAFDELDMLDLDDDDDDEYYA